jgi:hypothetical protein
VGKTLPFASRRTGKAFASCSLANWMGALVAAQPLAMTRKTYTGSFSAVVSNIGGVEKNLSRVLMRRRNVVRSLFR